MSLHRTEFRHQYCFVNIASSSDHASVEQVGLRIESSTNQLALLMRLSNRKTIRLSELILNDQSAMHTRLLHHNLRQHSRNQMSIRNRDSYARVVKYRASTSRRNYCIHNLQKTVHQCSVCLLYTSPSPRDQRGSRMPSSA